MTPKEIAAVRAIEQQRALIADSIGTQSAGFAMRAYELEERVKELEAEVAALNKRIAELEAPKE